ncbi:hypothetical protein [Amycolatopsis suaedae]|uniref:DUF3995 domain-containing protein n=1 Tax=Amycolatopsis suaedae TaxID=2510978 RepID=A0A4Q7J449_9PSEU|nr:hypothetical protein [Amycolatopsis suaedae]RZQ62310.1 hypothetical protein EWH70_18715 [Amycolatopsis suaedae]
MPLRRDLALESTAGAPADWAAVAAGVLGMVAVAASARGAGWAARVLAWGCCGVLLAVGGVVIFDVVMTVAHVADLTGPEALRPVDWPGAVTRLLCLTSAALLVSANRRDVSAPCVHLPRQPPRWRNVFGYLAFALSLPYPVLKTTWALGGRLGLTRSDFVQGFDAGWLPVVPALVGSVGALVLVQRWGRIVPSWVPVLGDRQVPRWPVLAGGWLATAVLCSIGPAAVYKGLQYLGQPESGLESWVPLTFYASWLLWGVALGGATLTYQQRTRPACRRCGR